MDGTEGYSLSSEALVPGFRGLCPVPGSSFSLWAQRPRLHRLWEEVASAWISSPSQGTDKTPKMTLTCHCKALSRCTGIQDSIGMWSSLNCVILTVSRQDKNQRSGWPAVPICSRPRGAPGCGMFSAKIDTVLDKPGWLVGANYHLACPQVPEKTWLRV